MPDKVHRPISAMAVEDYDSLNPRKRRQRAFNVGFLVKGKDERRNRDHG